MADRADGETALIYPVFAFPASWAAGQAGGGVYPPPNRGLFIHHSTPDGLLETACGGEEVSGKLMFLSYI